MKSTFLPIVMLVLMTLAWMPIPVMAQTMECDGLVQFVLEGDNVLHVDSALFSESEDLPVGTQVCILSVKKRIFTTWLYVVSETGKEGWIPKSRLGSEKEYLLLVPNPAPTMTAPIYNPSSTLIVPNFTPTPDAELIDVCTDGWGTQNSIFTVRTGPGPHHVSTGKFVFPGEQVCILMEVGDWFRLRKRDGTTGYTYKEGIAFQQPVTHLESTERIIPALEPVAQQETPSLVTSAVVSKYFSSLDSLTVADQSNLFNYEREDWKHWIDTDRDCQNTRHEVLIQESKGSVSFTRSDGCLVKSGQWTGPWSGLAFTLASDLDVDHHVPLKNAHISGGAIWPANRKRDYANDMELESALQAMHDRLNQAKGASGPENWKPPLLSSWCQYARDWVDVKTKWALTITVEEKSVLTEMLNTCAESPLQQPQSISAAASPRRSPQIFSATAAPAPTSVAGPTQSQSVVLLECKIREEFVKFRNDSEEAIDLSEFVIQDEGANFSYIFPQDFTIGASETWTLFSARERDSVSVQRQELHFTSRNVWNNTGDTAYLLKGTSLLGQLECN